MLRPGGEPLPLHDVPQLAQVGARDGVVGLEAQRPQIVGLGFGQLSVQVEDRAQVHERRRVLQVADGHAVSSQDGQSESQSGGFWSRDNLVDPGLKTTRCRVTPME